MILGAPAQRGLQLASVFLLPVIVLAKVHNPSIERVHSSVTLEHCRVLSAAPIGLIIQGFLADIVEALVQEQDAALLADHIAEVGQIWNTYMENETTLVTF